MKDRSCIPLSQLVCLLLAFSGSGNLLGWQEDSKQNQGAQLRDEEAEDYYENWFKQDVAYIITPEEKHVFENLTNSDEKDSFIEQFWRRRDSDPKTAINEFKEEHYRRIAFVNERFGSGLPGWRTDRGKTYIIHGPPTQIDPHPSGGTYDRPTWEGGGQTATFPFEIWRYRHIEGIGSDIELQFVDRSYSGEYKLALDPEEKDALLYIPLAGLMEAERMGLATRAQRPYFDPTSDYPMYQRQRDRPFDRFMLWNRIHHPPALKYPEMREIVEVDLSYGTLPFRVRMDYFRLSEEQVLAVISMEAKNKDLNWVDEMGVKVAKVAVYGIVTGMTQEIITEFDDDMVNRFSSSDFESAVHASSLYQKILPVDANKRYKLSFVVKDLNLNRIGVERLAITPPSFNKPALTASTLILSDSYQLDTDIPMAEQMFVIGNVWIHPSLSKTFTAARSLGAFFHVYNVSLDQTTYSPVIQAKYEVFRDGKPVLRLVEHNKESLEYFSEKTTVFLKQLPIQRLGPGKYQLKIEIRDQIKNESVTLQDRFEILDPLETNIQTAGQTEGRAGSRKNR
jgi:GWxTD domain-containing protein